ncbi:MAG: hypothetical protein H6767_09560 [Candidatus Peribacteria bacterium]|nr:MAG: hypothetical protein H6767_09560 [Candidatus Peribacteria bacterium]
MIDFKKIHGNVKVKYMKYLSGIPALCPVLAEEAVPESSGRNDRSFVSLTLILSMFKKIASNTIAQILSKAGTAMISIFLLSVLTKYLPVEYF